jgi:hypothetical protein
MRKVEQHERTNGGTMRNKWRLIALVLLSLLAACGRDGMARLTDDQVHRQWIAALRNNDRAAAQKLLAPEAQAYVDRGLELVQSAMNEAQFGKLKEIVIDVPIPHGVGRIGKSTWIFEQRTICYEASLAQIDGEWKITNWGARNCE